MYPILYDAVAISVSRENFVRALNAEGMPMECGYTQPLYLEPVYQQRIAFGKHGYPFTYEGYKGTVSYQKGLCPITERMYYSELMVTNICHAGTTECDLDDMVHAFRKVFENIEDLKEWCIRQTS